MAPMRIAPQGSRASRAARGARSEIRELPVPHPQLFLYYLSLNDNVSIKSHPLSPTHLPPSRYAATVGCPVAPHTVSTLYKEIPCTYT